MPNNLKNYFIREQVIQKSRDFFLEKKFHEVFAPVLLSSLPLEPNIYSLRTIWQYNQNNLYLATSPESTLKKLLSQGIGNCFSISSCFRDLEANGPTHHPEFLMLEWYEIGKNYITLMDSVENYIININERLGNKNNKRTNKILTYQKRSIDLTPPWPKITLKKLFASSGYKNLPDNEPDLNQIFLNHIEPHLPQNQPLFITDFPAFMSPLAQPNKNNQTSQRFELYLAGMELANGCTENTDPLLIKNHFNQQQQYRQQHQIASHSIDTDFIKNSAHLPPCAGVGLGLDRLTMIFADTTNINNILYSPLN
jgi:lysyl-tRNA synthetase class 2